MSDDLAGRLGDYATHLEDVGALPAAALVREAATRLSPPEGAGPSRVEAVARARSHELVAFGRQKTVTLAFTLRFIAESDNQEMRTAALLEAATRIEELTDHLEAALAVLPSEAEGAGPSNTNWALVDAKTDADIAADVASDPDAVPLGVDWGTAKLVNPRKEFP